MLFLTYFLGLSRDNFSALLLPPRILKNTGYLFLALDYCSLSESNKKVVTVLIRGGISYF